MPLSYEAAVRKNLDLYAYAFKLIDLALKAGLGKVVEMPDGVRRQTDWEELVTVNFRLVQPSGYDQDIGWRGIPVRLESKKDSPRQDPYDAALESFASKRDAISEVDQKFPDNTGAQRTLSIVRQVVGDATAREAERLKQKNEFDDGSALSVITPSIVRVPASSGSNDWNVLGYSNPGDAVLLDGYAAMLNEYEGTAGLSVT